MSFTPVTTPVPGEQVLPAQVTRDVVRMMESVVTEGSGRKASVAGYRIAGKTGTAWKASAGGYITNRYVSVFAGVAPVSAPRIATVVVIDEPSAGGYYGGEVAAPVFAEVVGGALRLLGVAPDAPLELPMDALPESGPSPAPGIPMDPEGEVATTIAQRSDASTQPVGERR